MRKQASITIRVDIDELEEIRRKANSLKITSSEFVRFCVNNATKQNYIPKTKVMYFLHRIYADAELTKLDKLIKIAKELEKSCL